MLNPKKLFTTSLIALFFISIFITSCDDNDPLSVDYSLAPEPFDIEGITPIEKQIGDHTLTIYIVEEGTSEITVERRDGIRLFYTGRKESDGEIFDSSYRNLNPNPATFGNLGSLITGFREGVIGMKEGGKRVLIIPPELGYGTSGGSSNLSGETLRFDIELDKIIL